MISENVNSAENAIISNDSDIHVCVDFDENDVHVPTVCVENVASPDTHVNENDFREQTDNVFQVQNENVFQEPKVNDCVSCGCGTCEMKCLSAQGSQTEVSDVSDVQSSNVLQSHNNNCAVQPAGTCEEQVVSSQASSAGCDIGNAENSNP